MASSWMVDCWHNVAHRKYIKVHVDARLDLVRCLRKMAWMKSRRQGLVVEPSVVPSAAAAISSSFFLGFYAIATGKESKTPVRH